MNYPDKLRQGSFVREASVSDEWHYIYFAVNNETDKYACVSKTDLSLFDNTKLDIRTVGMLIDSYGNVVIGGAPKAVSLLTVSNSPSNTPSYFRSWMKNGLTVTQNTDVMYFGMDATKGEGDSNKQLIAWGDDTPFWDSNGPDDLIFARIRIGNDPTIPPDELMRISIKECPGYGNLNPCQGNVRVGIGTSQVYDDGTKLMGTLHVKGAGETNPNVAAIYVDDPNLGIFVKSGGITVSGGETNLMNTTIKDGYLDIDSSPIYLEIISCSQLCTNSWGIVGCWNLTTTSCETN